MGGEETYCYDIPVSLFYVGKVKYTESAYQELLVQMQKVSRIAAICTRATTSTDALPEVVNEELAGSLHDVCRTT